MQKAEMVTAPWQSCKAKLDSRDSPDFVVDLASEYIGHLAVAVTTVALELSEADWANCLAVKVGLDTSSLSRK